MIPTSTINTEMTQANIGLSMNVLTFIFWTFDLLFPLLLSAVLHPLL